jgi:hypothetical protein
LSLDAIDQRVEVPSGQIGPANAPIEQHVASYGKAIWLAVKNDMSG